METLCQKTFLTLLSNSLPKSLKIFLSLVCHTVHNISVYVPQSQVYAQLISYLRIMIPVLCWPALLWLFPSAVSLMLMLYSSHNLEGLTPLSNLFHLLFAPGILVVCSFHRNHYNNWRFNYFCPFIPTLPPSQMSDSLACVSHPHNNLAISSYLNFPLSYLWSQLIYWCEFLSGFLYIVS